MDGINGVGSKSALGPIPGIDKKANVTFKEFLKDAFVSVNTAQTNADKAVVENLEGKGGIHETMLAMQEADISMRVLLQVRNKVIEAYREIMRMPF